MEIKLDQDIRYIRYYKDSGEYHDIELINSDQVDNELLTMTYTSNYDENKIINESFIFESDNYKLTPEIYSILSKVSVPQINLDTDTVRGSYGFKSLLDSIRLISMNIDKNIVGMQLFDDLKNPITDIIELSDKTKKLFLSTNSSSILNHLSEEVHNFMYEPHINTKDVIGKLSDLLEIQRQDLVTDGLYNPAQVRLYNLDETGEVIGDTLDNTGDSQYLLCVRDENKDSYSTVINFESIDNTIVKNDFDINQFYNIGDVVNFNHSQYKAILPSYHRLPVDSVNNSSATNLLLDAESSYIDSILPSYAVGKPNYSIHTPEVEEPTGFVPEVRLSTEPVINPSDTKYRRAYVLRYTYGGLTGNSDMDYDDFSYGLIKTPVYSSGNSRYFNRFMTRCPRSTNLSINRKYGYLAGVYSTQSNWLDQIKFNETISAISNSMIANSKYISDLGIYIPGKSNMRDLVITDFKDAVDLVTSQNNNQSAPTNLLSGSVTGSCMYSNMLTLGEDDSTKDPTYHIIDTANNYFEYGFYEYLFRILGTSTNYPRDIDPFIYSCISLSPTNSVSQNKWDALKNKLDYYSGKNDIFGGNLSFRIIMGLTDTEYDTINKSSINLVDQVDTNWLYKFIITPKVFYEDLKLSCRPIAKYDLTKPVQVAIGKSPVQPVLEKFNLNKRAQFMNFKNLYWKKLN